MRNKIIGIITLNGYSNYGNRVQNYAMEKIIEDIGYNTQTIRVNKPAIIRGKLSKLKRKLKNNERYNQSIKRESLFKSFSNTRLNETEKKYNLNKNLSSLSSHYDKFIVGSDQVWNPNMNYCSDIYFLQFVEKYKRISYSASFGVSSINKEVQGQYSRWLDGIPNISVREQEGSNIVKELTGRDVPVLVDPTLLLSRGEWLKLAKPGKSKPRKRYLLTYFLGTIPKKYQSQIQEIATKNQLEIVNIGDQEDFRYYETGPSEFIDYINDAEIFCTDSFHGVIFSILLEKPFIVYERKGSENMYSRIRTIIDNFGLQSREHKNIQTTNGILDIDYSGSYKIIEKEKEKSLTYLKKALSE